MRGRVQEDSIVSGGSAAPQSDPHPAPFLTSVRLPLRFSPFLALDQVAVNAYQWLTSNPAKWATIEAVTSPAAVRAAYFAAEASMARLNRDAASLMKQFGAKASTDVTGARR